MRAGADAAIIPEPTDCTLTRANVGVLWFQVEVRGRPAHVYESSVGSSAIIAAYGLISALQGLETEMNAEKGDHRYFEDMAKPITINIGKIAGGDWASSVPAWCRFDVRAGIYPGTSVEEAKQRVEQALRSACIDDPFLSNHPPSVTYNGFTAEGYTLEPGSDAEACLAAAHQRVRDVALTDATMPATAAGVDSPDVRSAQLWLVVASPVGLMVAAVAAGTTPLVAPALDKSVVRSRPTNTLAYDGAVTVKLIGTA